ncbi:MAG: GNAT family N-acetyltransferase [Deltaproteobacteria bacterium]|nr:GNAT family N-acetyltransferase [Deltaproteobacteria bacterium]
MAAKAKKREVKIREMRVDDISEVYRLGYRLFHSLEPTTLYRTWDAYEVTTNFNQDPRLSLVAEAPSSRIVGFALGTTYEKESGSWKYGHLLWIGVSPKWQGDHVGAQLCHEMERRMHEDGVRMVFMDAARSNAGALKFFKRMGYGKPESEVWMSKIIQAQPQKKKAAGQKKMGLSKRLRGRRRLPARP